MADWFVQNPAITAMLAVLIVYPFVMRALAKAARPARAALADDLRELEHDPNLPGNARRAIKMLGDAAFAWSVMPALVIAFPIIAAERVIRTDPRSFNPLAGFEPAIQARIDDAVWRFVLSVGAKNPIFAFIFALEVTLAAVIQVIATRILELALKSARQPSLENGEPLSSENGAPLSSSSEDSPIETLHRTLLNAVSRCDVLLARWN